MSRRTVLIVDDDPSTVRALRMVLEHAGWHALDADCADRALEVVASEDVSVIVVDLLMPGESGAWLARTLKAQGCPAPIVLHTGLLATPEELAPFDAVVPKPLAEVNDMIATLKRLTGNGASHG